MGLLLDETRKFIKYIRLLLDLLWTYGFSYLMFQNQEASFSE